MAQVCPTNFNPRLRRNSQHLAPLVLEDDYRERSNWAWPYSKPVSLEEVKDEGEQLLVHFVREEINKERLETPEELEEEFDLRYFIYSFIRHSSQSKPSLSVIYFFSARAANQEYQKSEKA